MLKNSILNTQRLIKAFHYSCQGFKIAWHHEAAIRQEIFVGVALIPLAFWLSRSAVELALLMLSMGVVLLAELTNTAIEFTVDRIGTEQHPLAGHAKDVGSAIVLFALILMAAVWTIVIF